MYVALYLSLAANLVFLASLVWLMALQGKIVTRLSGDLVSLKVAQGVLDRMEVVPANIAPGLLRGTADIRHEAPASVPGLAMAPQTEPKVGVRVTEGR